MTSQTEVQEAIKKKFQKSGNMARVTGRQSVAPEGDAADVAEVNAEAAQVAVAQQDQQLRGTSPQENLQADATQGEQPPEGAPEQQEEQEELIKKSTFIKRTANEVRRRIAAEEELATLKAERETQAPPRQEPRQEHQAEPEYDEEDPLAQQLRLTNERLDRIEQVTQTNQRDQIHREAVRALGGNEDLFVLVNEVWDYGRRGIDIDEALVIAEKRNPEIRFEGVGDDGTEGPSLYAQSGSAEPSGNRTIPDTEEDERKGLVARLGQTVNQSERTRIGRDIMRGKIGKLKIFGDRTQASLR